MASIESGLPLLREIAAEEGREAVAELEKLIERGLTLVPETVPTLSGGGQPGGKSSMISGLIIIQNDSGPSQGLVGHSVAA